MSLKIVSMMLITKIKFKELFIPRNFLNTIRKNKGQTWKVVNQKKFPVLNKSYTNGIKGVCILRPSGSITIMGATSLESAEQIYKSVLKDLDEFGIKYEKEDETNLQTL